MNYQLKFWGVKGSCPGAAPGAYAYAVNTSCIEVSSDDELILLDAGSGIVFLGQEGRSFDAYDRCHLFLTHYHYDHILGVPFFKPFYDPNQSFEIYGPVTENGGPEDALRHLFQPLFLPMPFEAMRANLHFHPLFTADFVSLKHGEVHTLSTDHPGGNLAYRIHYGGKTFAYLTDLGHSSQMNQALVDFCRDVDAIYYDANFTQSEYLHGRYEGWGHSTHAKGVALLDASHAKHLYLGHHALHRSDAELDTIQAQFDATRITVVKEGMVLTW